MVLAKNWAVSAEEIEIFLIFATRPDKAEGKVLWYSLLLKRRKTCNKQKELHCARRINTPTDG